jgi:hypothetical protein
MSDTTRCTRCGGDRVIPDAKVEDRGDHLRHQLEVLVGYANPEALLFTDPIRADLRASVCGTCGHVDLFVSDPGALWQAWTGAPSQQPPR